jgi:hypothetical protein
LNYYRAINRCSPDTHGFLTFLMCNGSSYFCV